MLRLRHHLEFEDLYSRAGLQKLDAAFLNYVAQGDAALAERLRAARRAPPARKDESELLIALAPQLEDFLAQLFGIEAEAHALAAKHNELAPLWSVKRLFVQRRALHKVKPEDATPEGYAFSTELRFAQDVTEWQKDEAANAAQLEGAARYAAWAATTLQGKAKHAHDVLFRAPRKLDFMKLIPVPVHERKREGFALTDAGTDLKGALDEANYCIWCHEQGKDSCSTGLKEKAPAAGFKKTVFKVPLAGCPLEEKISEFHMVKTRGQPIGALGPLTAYGFCFQHDHQLLCVDPLTQRTRWVQDKLSVWYCTPSSLVLMLTRGGLEKQDLSALRVLLFAGEVFPVKHLRLLVSLWSHPTYYNLYGPTETNVCTFARIPTPIPDDRTEPYPIGPACSHCDDLVLDADNNPVTDGEEGLLYMAGPSVFGGYWNRPEENASRFIERDGRRWYNTGDVVRKEPHEGYIYIGRRDRMVKRRGYRIELGEIETALYRHKKLREVGTIARAAQDGVKILAYVSAQTAERPSLVDLKAFSAQVLPSYMIPDSFIVLERLPRTSTDKIDYQALTRSATQPAPAL